MEKKVEITKREAKEKRENESVLYSQGGGTYSTFFEGREKEDFQVAKREGLLGKNTVSQ